MRRADPIRLLSGRREHEWHVAAAVAPDGSLPGRGADSFRRGRSDNHLPDVRDGERAVPVEELAARRG